MLYSNADKNTRRSRLGRGYLIALGGIALFLASVLIGAALQIDGPAATALVFGSFWLMAVAFWVGTALVAVDKGYNVIVGIILGFFAPLGLLIVTLMPDRMTKVVR